MGGTRKEKMGNVAKGNRVIQQYVCDTKSEKKSVQMTIVVQTVVNVKMFH